MTADRTIKCEKNNPDHHLEGCKCEYCYDKPMTAQHTPTPWMYYENGSVGRDKTPMYTIGFGIGGMLGEVVGEANAQFIVKAVNCHEELLEACKKALKHPENREEESEINYILSQAIAHAEKEA